MKFRLLILKLTWNKGSGEMEDKEIIKCIRDKKSEKLFFWINVGLLQKMKVI